MVPIDLQARWNELTAVPRNDHPKNWGVNSKFSAGELKLVMIDGEGALELRATGQDGKQFQVFNREVFIKTAPGSVVLVKVIARGQGELQMVGYLYDAASDSVGSAIGEQTNSTSLSAESFSELHYRIVVPLHTGKKAEPTQMRMAIALAPGAEVWIKSIEAETNTAQ